MGLNDDGNQESAIFAGINRGTFPDESSSVAVNHQLSDQNSSPTEGTPPPVAVSQEIVPFVTASGMKASSSMPGPAGRETVTLNMGAEMVGFTDDGNQESAVFAGIDRGTLEHFLMNLHVLQSTTDVVDDDVVGSAV